MSNETQLALVNGSALTERDMFSAIDGIVEELSQTGNIQKAVSVLNILDKIDNVTGHVKAKLLWNMQNWYKVNKPQDDFGDYIESTSSTKRVTVDRYVNVWQQIEDENIPKKIQSRAMRDLVPISNMLSQGFEPSKKRWDEINLCTSSSELGEVIRKVKGKKPRKSARINQMERDGSLYTWKNNVRKWVGTLDVEGAKEDTDIAEAIEQILAGKPIIRR